MQNHIYRHGLMAKKTWDGRRMVYLHKDKPRKRSPYDYGGTIVTRNVSKAGCCGFNHEPYALNLNVVDADQETPDNSGFQVSTTAEHVMIASKVCEFCEILWLGLQKYRDYWEEKWDFSDYNNHILNVADSNNYSPEQYYREVYDKIAQIKYRMWHSIDLSKVICRFASKNDPEPKSLECRLMKEPYDDSNWARWEQLMTLEFHTIEGMFSLHHRHLLSPLGTVYEDPEKLMNTGKPSSWTVFGPAPQVSGDILANNSVQKLSRWIDDCVENHSFCDSINQRVLPTRLLYVEPTSNPERANVRLHETNPSQQYKFVALSHCWANTKPIKTTSENLTQRLQDIGWDELSVSFKDTIRLALSLGIS